MLRYPHSQIVRFGCTRDYLRFDTSNDRRANFTLPLVEKFTPVAGQNNPLASSYRSRKPPISIRSWLEILTLIKGDEMKCMRKPDLAKNGKDRHVPFKISKRTCTCCAGVPDAKCRTGILDHFAGGSKMCICTTIEKMSKHNTKIDILSNVECQ